MNQYPHLKADNNQNIFGGGGATASQRSTQYNYKVASGGNVNNQVIPVSYADRSKAQMGPAGNQDEITHRLNSY